MNCSMVFEAFHHYAGMGVGEHLGYLSTSLWTLLVAIVIVRGGALPRRQGVVIQLERLVVGV